jgi:hypothetical protein
VEASIHSTVSRPHVNSLSAFEEAFSRIEVSSLSAFRRFDRRVQAAPAEQAIQQLLGRGPVVANHSIGNEA